MKRFHWPSWLTDVIRSGRFGRLSPSAQRVLVAVVIHANGSGEAWPGQDRIKYHLGMGDRAIRNALRDLRASGLVEVLKRRGSSTLYRFAQSAQQDLAEPPAERQGVDRQGADRHPLPNDRELIDPVERHSTPCRTTHYPPVDRHPEAVKNQEEEEKTSPVPSQFQREEDGESHPVGHGGDWTGLDDGQGPVGPAVQEETEEETTGTHNAPESAQQLHETHTEPGGPVSPWREVTMALEAEGLRPSIAAARASKLLDAAGGESGPALETVRRLAERAVARADGDPAGLLAWLCDQDGPALAERLAATPAPVASGADAVDQAEAYVAAATEDERKAAWEAVREDWSTTRAQSLEDALRGLDPFQDREALWQMASAIAERRRADATEPAPPRPVEPGVPESPEAARAEVDRILRDPNTPEFLKDALRPEWRQNEQDPAATETT